MANEATATSTRAKTKTLSNTSTPVSIVKPRRSVGVKCEDPKYQLTRGSEKASGYDLRAKLEHTLYLGPLERALVLTGVWLDLPENYDAKVLPRSGNAIKKGLTVLNAPGLIDEDYRGEIGVILINLSQEAVTINDGDAIAQIIFQTKALVELESVEELSITERGDKGYGSSGVIGEK